MKKISGYFFAAGVTCLVGAANVNDAKAGDIDIFDALDAIRQGAELVDRLQNPQRYEYRTYQEPRYAEPNAYEECNGIRSKRTRERCFAEFGIYPEEQRRPRYRRDYGDRTSREYGPGCQRDWYLPNGNRGGTYNACKGQTPPSGWGSGQNFDW